MRHSTYTNNQNYNKVSKYSPAKRDDVSPNNRMGGGNLTPKGRMRTYTSPIYEGNVSPNNNMQSNYQGQDYRMAESYMQAPNYGGGQTASFFPMNQSAYVGNNGGGQFNGNNNDQKLDFS